MRGLVVVGMGHAAAVDIEEKAAETLVEHPGNIGAVEAAVARKLVEGKVAVEIALLFFHLLADGGEDFFLFVRRQDLAFQALVLFNAHGGFQLVHLHRTVRGQGAEQQDDGQDGKDEQTEGKGPELAVDGHAPAHDQVQDGNQEDELRVLLREVVGVGIVLVGEAGELADEHQEGQHETDQVDHGQDVGDDEEPAEKISLHLCTGHERRHHADDRHHRVGAHQDIDGSVPPVYFENPSEIVENQHGTMERRSQDQHQAQLHDGIGFVWKKNDRAKHQVGQETEDESPPVRKVIVHVLGIGRAPVPPAHNGNHDADSHIDCCHHTQEQLREGVGHR